MTGEEDDPGLRVLCLGDEELMGEEEGKSKLHPRERWASQKGPIIIL
jgi:hypothetical protein